MIHILVWQRMNDPKPNPTLTAERGMIDFNIRADV